MISEEKIKMLVHLIDEDHQADMAKDIIDKMSKIEQNEALDRILYEAYYGLGFYMDYKGKTLKDFSPIVRETLFDVSIAAQQKYAAASEWKKFFSANAFITQSAQLAS